MRIPVGNNMKSFKVWLSLMVLVVAGCATPGQFLDSKQGMAVDTALQRGRFEMNCPEATGTVLSREVIQPPQGPYAYGIQRGEFTIGVAGCGQRKTFVVLCPDDGTGCFAAR